MLEIKRFEFFMIMSKGNFCMVSLIFFPFILGAWFHWKTRSHFRIKAIETTAGKRSLPYEVNGAGSCGRGKSIEENSNPTTDHFSSFKHWREALSEFRSDLKASAPTSSEASLLGTNNARAIWKEPRSTLPYVFWMWAREFP